MRIEGRITRLVRDQGFGFIRAAQGDHIFHSSALRGALFEDLVGGEAVTFTPPQAHAARAPKTFNSHSAFR